MKQEIINSQIHPALERNTLWRAGEPTPRSKREKSQAFGVYLLRFIVIAALLLAVLSASTDNKEVPNFRETEVLSIGMVSEAAPPARH